jgi:hypothetical protein
MKKFLAGLLVAGVVVVTLLWWDSEREREAKALSARADSLHTRAAALQKAATAIQHEADSLRSVASLKDTVFRIRMVAVRDTTPISADCAAVVAERDSLLDEAVAVVDAWRRVDTVQVRVTDTVRVAAETAVAADSTRRTAVELLTGGLRFSLGAIRLEARPAVFGGRCISGGWCAGVGIAVSLGRRR